MIGFPIFRFLSFPLSFLFPGYRSFCAVMSENNDDDENWLSYWLVYAFVQFFELAFTIVVATFPFYYELKCVFIMLLQAKNAKLAHKLYKKFLGPVLETYEPAIDAFIDKYSQQAVAITHTANRAANQVFRERSIQLNLIDE